MRGLPLRVIAEHTPSERAAIQVRAGERVAVGRYDRDPDGWPAFRFVTTTGGAEVEVRTVAGATRRVDGAASLRCEVLPGLAVEPAQRTVRR